ncbi:hypothetical protein M413DRAFT_12412 [Hebeloma cylindrosporum]|uniref:MYND-type domain-containing protein n=1 Tax=Hebeloma cylindrosporum TaxID=76867 RepID=A0A0C3C6A8_HEBCY|nr:hypothetical protein M413DRAFT_12412 [Hebeloma cylindrosporum h7]
MTMAYDLKHTNAWECAGCGEPARETLYDMASWIHLPQPRVVFYSRTVDSSPLRGGKEHLSSSDQCPDEGDDSISDRRYSPNASTVGEAGWTDESVALTSARCGGCKLVRYCGADCQNQDWKRHKKICKTINSVKWVNWD